MATANVIDQALGNNNPSGMLKNNDHWNNVNQTDHPATAFVNAHAPMKGQVMEDRSGTVASRFPALIEKGDPRDRDYALRKTVINDRGEIPGLGKMMADHSDVEYLRKKADDANEADFKAWFLAQMDLSSPEKQAYWQSKFGDVFAERKSLLNQQLELQKQLALIRIMGPQTKDDYLLLWSIERGFIEVPKGAIFDPNNVPQIPFHRGLFNVKKLFAQDGSANSINFGAGRGTDKTAFSRNRVNFKDPLSSRGDGTYNFGSFLGL